MLAFLLPAGCSGSATGSGPVIQVAFTDRIDVVTASGEAPPDSTAEGEAIVGMISGWYQRAFVDPAGWKDPEFPDVVQLFTGSARERVEGELDSVTIGQVASRVRAVVPDLAGVDVTLYADDDGASSYAVADVIFRATAALKGSGEGWTISQTGTYFLRETGDGWRIFAYQARNDQAPARPAGAP